MDDLAGWRVMVTAGGTREPIDPVRYIGNRSSGKMGWNLAAVAAERGADTLLITTVDPPVVSSGMDTDIEIVRVETAQQMADVVWDRVGAYDVLVMAAAVADFRPKDPLGTKLSRADGPPTLVLEPAPDILNGVVAAGHETFVVGFAAETGHIDRAVKKAIDKGVDLMVANDVTAPGAGFAVETNTVSLIFPDRRVESWPNMSKREVAERLWDVIADLRSRPS